MDQHVATLLGSTRIGYCRTKNARYSGLYHFDLDWFRRSYDGNITGNIAIAIRINTYRREIGRQNDNLREAGCHFFCGGITILETSFMQRSEERRVGKG